MNYQCQNNKHSNVLIWSWYYIFKRF